MLITNIYNKQYNKHITYTVIHSYNSYITVITVITVINSYIHITNSLYAYNKHITSVYYA